MANRITNFLNRLFPSSEPVAKVTVQSLKLELQSQSNERLSVVEKSRQMYENDPRVKSSILMMARDMSKASMQIKVTNSARAQKSANTLLKRIRMAEVLNEWCRSPLIDGDIFLWLKILNNQIVEVQKLPPLYVQKLVNEFMQFEDPRKAYAFTENSNYYGQSSVIKFFNAFEVVHAKWDDDSNLVYGVPLFQSAVSPYIRATDGENDMYVKRRTRAGARYIHVLENASEPQLAAYKEAHAALFSNPLVAISDFFTNTKGGINLIEPNTRFDDIKDVEHQIETFLTASPVPSGIIGYGDKVSRDVLVAQQLRYDLTIDHLTETWVVPKLIRPLLERQWLMDGMLPENIDFDVYWRYRVILSPAELQSLADAVLRLRAAGFTEPLVAKLVARYVPNMTVEELEKNIKPIEVKQDDLNHNGSDENPRAAKVASTVGDTDVALSKK